MATGTATLDFGASVPAESATVLVGGQSGLSSSSYLEAFFMKESTADNGVDEHEEAAAMCPLVCEFVSATSFNIIGTPIGVLGLGQFNVRWVTVP